MHMLFQIALTPPKFTSPRMVTASNVIEASAAVSPTDTLLAPSVARHYLSMADIVSVEQRHKIQK